MRDMILVERVTDGGKCGSNCGQKDWRGYNHKNEGVNLCVAFKRERLWGDNSKPKRCPQCHATPSAVVLTDTQPIAERLQELAIRLRRSAVIVRMNDINGAEITALFESYAKIVDAIRGGVADGGAK